MANTLGALLVRLGLDAAEYTKGLTKAEYDAQKFARNVDVAMKKVGSTLAALGGATLIYRFTKGVIDAADHLQDLSERSGIAVEELNGLTYALTLNGASAEDVGTAIKKLSKSISEAGTGNRELQELFKTLGMPEAARGAGSVTDALLGLAKAFPRLSDTDRLRVAMQLLGKSGDVIVPSLAKGADALRDLIKEGQVLNPITGEMAKKANEFNDAMQKVTTALKGALLPVIELLGPFTELVEQMAAGKRAGLDFAQSLDMGKYLVGDPAANIKLVRDRINELEEADAKFRADKGGGVVGFINSLTGGNVGSINTTPLADLYRTLSILEGMQKEPPKPPGGKINLPDKNADAIAKRMLDAQIKALEDAIRTEQELMGEHSHFLQEAFQDDLISIRDFYAARIAIINNARDKQVAAYDDEIAALRTFANSAKPEQRIEAEAKIAEAVSKRSKVQRQAANEAVNGYIEEKRALKEYQSQLEQFQATLLAARGDTVGAAMTAFDEQYRAFRDKLKREGQSTAGVDELRGIVENRAKLDKATQDYTLTLDELGIAQEHINNLVTAGAATELDALRMKSDLTASYIETLKKQLAVAEQLAALSGKREDIIHVMQLKVALEGLEAQGDLVAKKFTDIFETSFVDALVSVVDGTKSLKDAFHDMARSIARDINHIAAQQIAKQIFGTGTPANSAIGWFASLFAPTAAAGAASNYGTIDASMAGNGLIGGAGAYASGTSYAPGGMAWVGERGPELVNLPRGSQVIPFDKAKRAGGTVNIVTNVTVPGSTSRATADQIGVQVGIAASRALRRNS